MPEEFCSARQVFSDTASGVRVMEVVPGVLPPANFRHTSGVLGAQCHLLSQISKMWEGTFDVRQKYEVLRLALRMTF